MSVALPWLVTRPDDVAPQPWRNGGGLTRELLAWPSREDWQLRLSVADIEADGPFSSFPGVQRWFCVLQGAGVELCIDGRPSRLQPGDPALGFEGSARTQARLLQGPTRDLNLMLRGPRGGLLPASPGQAWQPPGAPWGLYACVAGQLADASSAPAAVPTVAPAAVPTAPRDAAPRFSVHATLDADSLLACLALTGGPVQFLPSTTAHPSPCAGWWWWTQPSQDCR